MHAAFEIIIRHELTNTKFGCQCQIHNRMPAKLPIKVEDSIPNRTLFFLYSRITKGFICFLLIRRKLDELYN